MTTDPRKLPGDVAGPGGPHDRNSVVLDTTHAVLLDGSTAVVGHNGSDGRDFVALLLEGRINRTQDRVWQRLEHALAIHGHNGDTNVHWLDNPR